MFFTGTLKPTNRFKVTDRTGYFALTMLLVAGALLFASYHMVFSHLIFNSNINFETFKVLDLNVFSLVGFISLLLLFGFPFLYILKILKTVKPDSKTFILSALTAMIVFPVFFISDLPGLISAAMFYLLVTLLTWRLGKQGSGDL